MEKAAWGRWRTEFEVWRDKGKVEGGSGEEMDRDKGKVEGGGGDGERQREGGGKSGEAKRKMEGEDQANLSTSLGI